MQHDRYLEATGVNARVEQHKAKVKLMGNAVAKIGKIDRDPP